MKLADLPWHERPATELLGLGNPDRAEVDVSYAGHGWARVASVWLDDGRQRRRVDNALVLGLHSADDAPAQADDILLEFALGDADDAPTVSAPLGAFLAAWLPRLPPDGPIVLAMCNPHRADLPHPAAAGARTVFYGVGEVDAWLDDDVDVRLVATAWRTTSPRSAA